MSAEAPLIFRDERLPARFWSKVIVAESGCWVWTGSLHMSGYGSISIRGARGTSSATGAHRFAWLAENGSLPDVLDHICHERACVNTAHLRPVTPKQNCENLLGAYRSSKSGVRGVRQRNSGMWEARVQHNGVLVELSGFDTMEAAEVAAIELRNRLFTHNDADRMDGAA